MTIQEVGGAKKSEVLEINNIPYIHYLDMSDIQSDVEIDYVFFDSNGNVIE